MSPSLYDLPAPECAAALIGVGLFVEGVGGTIVETEAYRPDDPASHSFAGRTARNGAMFGPVGCAYVYRSYGLHWCFNIVCGDPGSAVLIRALAPEAGLEAMRVRRRMEGLKDLCRGPGRLCQALGLEARHDGAHLSQPPFRLVASKTCPDLVTGPRIGISRGVDTPWRFGLRGSAFLSRAFRP
ncbi:DNA-3-methyladenine glycosylase [Lichenihabitans sp. Uapishka_5]|uniref:DNA-3-methyladenine glycosylase n=1 Tax=Lichenihabitans sp. Uapishka_5 TaxID=3037302 RepID=UPI0029E7FDBD|nr:DNA-3-methyladenine glycosylase [Lichenihabitans sp. Uapishka_5]MDX7950642.1 DNA-3-methyladenine glycosylase [Lichenihabitans sp. Uapishka_5]